MRQRIAELEVENITYFRFVNTFLEPILGNATPVFAYEPGSWGPAEADRLVADLGGWHNPH